MYLAVLFTALVASSAADPRAVAEHELELAKSNVPYFVLDIPQRALRLKLRGVELRTYKLLTMELGRTLWGTSDRDWMDKVYDVEPRPMAERLEIKPPPDGASAAPGTPALPESQPEEVPSAYTIHCGPALSLRVVSDGPGRLWLGALADRFVDLTLGWRSVQLRLKMSVEDAHAWHRSWPTAAKLLIVRPTTAP